MAIVGTSIFILHQSKLQVSIWQKILQSHGLTAIALPVNTNLSEQLLAMESKNMSFPRLILLDQNLPSFDVAAFCRWMQTRPPAIPIILLTNQTQKIESATRQLALSNGAAEILPQFDLGTFAIEAVNALKAVTQVIDGVEIDNKALITCIMDLKREIHADAPSPANPATANRQTPEKNDNNEAPAMSPAKQQSKRTYRGREY